MNPYEILGLPADATPEQVKHAYRRAAAAAHPDREEGNPERMALVNAANDILSDPAKRKRYDETGATGATRTPQELATANLANMMSQLIEDFDCNIIARARELIKSATRDHEADIKKRTKLVAKLQARKAKITSALEQNLVHEIIDSTISSHDAKISELTEALTIMRLMLEELAHYSSSEIEQPRGLKENTIISAADMEAVFRQHFGGSFP